MLPRAVHNRISGRACSNAKSWAHHLPTESAPRGWALMFACLQAPLVIPKHPQDFIHHSCDCSFLDSSINSYWTLLLATVFKTPFTSQMMEKGYDLLVRRWVGSQLKLLQQKERWGGWKATVAEAVLLPCLKSWEGRFLSLETNHAPYYSDSTSHSRAKRPWTWTSQHILPCSPGTTHFHSFLHNRGHPKTALQRDRKVSVALGISFRLPEEHFTKKQVARPLTVQHSESEPPFETH